MLFNSYEFIFLFLPLALGVFLLLTKISTQYNLNKNFILFWLILISAFFYGWWNPDYLPLLIASILFNFSISKLMQQFVSLRKTWLIIGLSVNLMTLGYYKYLLFLSTEIFRPLGFELNNLPDELPLGISFFTFQQIAYLIDIYWRKVKESSLPVYATFVSFFPHLIAGPLVLNNDIADQLRNQPRTPKGKELSLGLFVFAVGLFKKVVIADSLAPYSSSGFKFVEGCGLLDFEDAWMSVLSYTFQLYFDFSGYSDMAFGAAMMFGLKLPQNFNSPYRSFSIQDFWRRWHMTLSHFLRNYVYIPLGGNRRGRLRRYTNLIITMLLGGVWHGAGWNFLIWGLWHGAALAINTAWNERFPLWLSHHRKWIAYFLTMSVVVIGWVFFRAHSFNGAVTMLKSIAGFADAETYIGKHNWPWVIKAALICWLLPNVFQMSSWLHYASTKNLTFASIWNKYGDYLLSLFSVLIIIKAISEIGGYHEFLYFQF